MTDLLYCGLSGPVGVGPCPGSVREAGGEPGGQGDHLDQHNCLEIHGMEEFFRFCLKITELTSQIAQIASFPSLIIGDVTVPSLL